MMGGLIKYAREDLVESIELQCDYGTETNRNHSKMCTYRIGCNAVICSNL